MKKIFLILFTFCFFNLYAQVAFQGNEGQGWASVTSSSTANPKWVKITRTYADFSTAGVTNDVLIYTLPTKGIIHVVQLVPTVVFTGGLIATYTISVGIAGNLTKYAIATNVFTGATLPAISVIPGIESTSGTTAIRAAAISTVGNLNAASQGSIDIYILISTLP